MKKIIYIILTVILSCSLFSCGHDTPAEDGQLHVVTTLFPYYDFIRSVGGDRVEVQLLLKPGTESHTYEPSPQDMIAIENCDLFVYNGGESEAWVEQILSGMDKEEDAVFRGMQYVTSSLRSEEEAEGMQERILHIHGEEAEYDEHIWTSPVIAEELVTTIAEKLSLFLPSAAGEFSENARVYLGKLNQLDAEIRAIVEQAERTNIVFGDRFPFLYFAKTYGLTYHAAFPGCSSESEPSAKTVAFLSDKVKRESIPVVFYIEFSNQKIADTICEESNAEKLLFHSCHNITAEEMSAGVTYLDLMYGNVENLRKALTK